MRGAGTDTIERLFREALEAGHERNYPKAVQLLTEIVGKTDQHPQALLYLGRSYHAMGSYDRAVQALEFFVRIKPDSSAGHFFLGRSYLSLNIYGKAIHHLRICSELNPGFAPAYSLLGLSFLKSRRPEKAVAFFQKALEQAPDDPRILNGYMNANLFLAIRLFYRGQLIDSARIFQDILKHRERSMVSHLYLAAIFKEMGRTNLSLFHLEAASEMAPRDPVLRLQKGVIFLGMGESKKALLEIDVAAQLLNQDSYRSNDPQEILRFITVILFRERRYKEAIYYGSKLLHSMYGDPHLHVIVAESYRILGDLEKAKNHYQRALEKEKNSIELHYGMLMVLWELKNLEELAVELKRIIRLNPEDEIAHYYNALCLSKLGGSPEKAIEILQQQIRKKGPDPLLMTALAQEYLDNGLPDLAVGWYIRTLKLNEREAESLLGLAEAYRALGNWEKEKEILGKYLDFYPDARQVRKTLLKILLEKELFGEASCEISRLLPFEPGNRRLKKMLAICYRKTGRFQEAIVILKDLLKGEPDSEELIKSLIYCLDKSGSREIAILVLQKALGRLTESIPLNLILGVLYYKDGLFEKAAEIFRNVISLSPSEWKAYQNLGLIYQRMGNAVFAEKFLKRAESYRTAIRQTPGEGGA